MNDEAKHALELALELVKTPTTAREAAYFLREAARHLDGRNNDLGDISDFHTKFAQKYAGPPRFLDPETSRFRVKFLREEVQEFEDATTHHDKLDALVDLDYVLKGTVYLCGYSRMYRAAWNRVHAANMQKELAGDPSRSKRGFANDVVKPAGWKPADLTSLFW